MSFAAPIAFALAALAVPILVLYILKVRMRRLPVSTNLFWRQIYDEKPPRSIWQNLRHLLSLLAQLAFLIMLVLAVADPYLPWQLLQARRLVLVVDNSASMQATDVAPNRLQGAKEYALDLVAGLRERDEVAIVVAGQLPEVVVGMTGHVPTLRRAIESIEPSDKSTHLASGIALGKKLIGAHPHGQVLVLTDGCVTATEDESATKLASAPAVAGAGLAALANETETETDTEAKTKAETKSETEATSGTMVDAGASVEAVGTPGEAAVLYQIFGEPANNIGITQFQVRRSLTDPLGYEILASVLNASTQPAKCRLEVTLDETPIDVVPLKLEPGELWKRSFEKTSIEGGTLVGRLTQFESLEQSTARDVGGAASTALNESAESPESTERSGRQLQAAAADATADINRLQVDDTAWALLPKRSRQKVLLVTPGNLFLKKVLEASPLVDLTVSETLPEPIPTDALVVLHRDTPEKIPVGDVFVLDPAGDSDLWKIAGQIADPIITQQAEDSPLMTHIRLDSVVVPSALKLDFQVPAQVLAGTVNEDPIYASLRRDGGRCLVLLVNLEESDLAFRTAFPIMVTNALNWFANQSGRLNPSLATGSLVEVELPSADELPQVAASGEVAGDLRLQSPQGQSVVLSPAAGASDLSVGPLDRVGVWELSRAGAAGGEDSPEESVKRFAVNISSERETDLQPAPEFLDRSDSRLWGGRWFTRPIWFYLAMLAVLFTGIEWFLYHRRFIS